MITELHTCIAIKQQDLGETDKLYTFFSKDLGKIRAIAKGAKKLTSKLAPFLQYGQIVNVSFTGKSELKTIANVEYLISFPNLFNTEVKAKLLFQINEILNNFIVEGQPATALFETTSDLLKTLNTIDASSTNIDNLLIKFLIEVLQTHGVGIQYEKVDPSLPIYFDTKQGGFLNLPNSLSDIKVNTENFNLFCEISQRSYIEALNLPSNAWLKDLIISFAEQQIERQLKTAKAINVI